MVSIEEAIKIGEDRLYLVRSSIRDADVFCDWESAVRMENQAKGLAWLLNILKGEPND